MAKYEKYFREILSIDEKCVSDLQNTLDMKVMDEIVDLLLTVKKNSKKVITAGCGTSGIAGEKIAHSLSVVEVPAFFLSPANSIHGGMGAIQEGDIAVLLSKGGNTPEIVNYIPVCKAKGAKIIGVTQIPDSILGTNCDILLNVVVERETDPWNLIASGSILAVLATWDAIALTIMQHNGFTKEDFFLTHPGGSAGTKLEAMLVK